VVKRSILLRRESRSDTSRLRLTNHFHWYSLGFDLNDMGYLRQADLIANQVFLGWSEPMPKGIFRDYSVQLSREDHWDFGGLQTRASTSADASAQFTNKWRVSGSLAFIQSVDTRALRGGPAVRRSDFYTASLGVGTDSSRPASLSAHGYRERALEGGSGEWQADGELRLRPSNRLSLSADASYMRATDDLQYVATAEALDGPRWALGRIDQEVWDLTFRANLSVTPELTVQYYGSPFIATGRYTSFKKATDTLARSYEDRFHRYGDSEIAYPFQMKETSLTAADITKQQSLFDSGSAGMTKKPGRSGSYPGVVPMSTSPSLNTTRIFRPTGGCEGSNSLRSRCFGLPTRSLTKNMAFSSVTRTSIDSAPGSPAVLRWKRSLAGRKSAV
jgi:hypothetical protein